MRKFLLLPAFMLLAGFNDPEFGMVVTGNIAAQTIEPAPVPAGAMLPGGNGRRSVAAYRRYLSGNQKALIRADARAEIGQQGGAADSPSVGEPK